MVGWGEIVKQYRMRHGISQARMAAVMSVSQRTVSRWERGEDNPSISQQKRLRDLGWEPPGSLLRNLAASIAHCPAPRALTRTQRLRLNALSTPALAKRPSISNWIGRDMIEIACGVLQEMLDDRTLQKAIRKKEISAVVTTSRSVLRTVESPGIGAFRTTITYFFYEGTFYSDAISFPAPPDISDGYVPIPMDAFFMGGDTGSTVI
jgi:transcriptional regulator with XRE-family HTH domain